MAHVVEGRSVGGDEREGGLAEHFGFVVAVFSGRVVALRSSSSYVARASQAPPLLA